MNFKFGVRLSEALFSFTQLFIELLEAKGFFCGMAPHLISDFKADGCKDETDYDHDLETVNEERVTRV